MQRPHVIILCGSLAATEQFVDGIPEDEIAVERVFSAEQLHRSMSEVAMDAVVVEEKLEGFFSGIDILEKIHHELLRPATILLSPDISQVRDRAQQIGVDRVLPSNTSGSVIAETILTLTHPNADGAKFISDRARRLVGSVSLPNSPPNILLRFAPRLLSEEEISIAELTETISVDPSIAAQLLSLVNSPAMGLSVRVSSLFDAINLLGTRATLALILSCRAHDSFLQFGRKISDSMRSWHQRRSVMVACIASAFVKRLGNVSPETAYLLGLLQELGILVLVEACGATYESMLGRFRHTGHLRLESLERGYLRGLTHADVGAALLENWCLPVPILRLVANHHDDSGQADHWSDGNRQFLAAMRSAEAFVDLADGHVETRHNRFRRAMEAFGRTNRDDILSALNEGIANTVVASELFRAPKPSQTKMRQTLDQLNTILASSPTAADSESESPTSEPAIPG
ncbi:HDOD domain protein [Planctomycetes bacterium Pan216]|uniref:HDOD domain protein n=1 Tax=Kolteria novifilia TaxID=2527975 RepID=A0A518B447_9BACT|nr:HDOD domain protein [Planctomycetes bacterium Pan216]